MTSDTKRLRSVDEIVFLSVAWPMNEKLRFSLQMSVTSRQSPSTLGSKPPPSPDRDLKHFESLNESEVYNKKKFLVEMFLSILQAERNYL